MVLAGKSRGIRVGGKIWSQNLPRGKNLERENCKKKSAKICSPQTPPSLRRDSLPRGLLSTRNPSMPIFFSTQNFSQAAMLRARSSPRPQIFPLHESSQNFLQTPSQFHQQLPGRISRALPRPYFCLHCFTFFLQKNIFLKIYKKKSSYF